MAYPNDDLADWMRGTSPRREPEMKPLREVCADTLEYPMQRDQLRHVLVRGITTLIIPAC